MIKRLVRFGKDLDGAVTVDWVVLTAAIVGMNILLIFSPIRTAIFEMADRIGERIALYQASIDQPAQPFEPVPEGEGD